MNRTRRKSYWAGVMPFTFLFTRFQRRHFSTGAIMPRAISYFKYANIDSVWPQTGHIGCGKYVFLLECGTSSWFHIQISASEHTRRSYISLIVLSGPTSEHTCLRCGKCRIWIQTRLLAGRSMAETLAITSPHTVINLVLLFCIQKE